MKHLFVLIGILLPFSAGATSLEEAARAGNFQEIRVSDLEAALQENVKNHDFTLAKLYWTTVHSGYLRDNVIADKQQILCLLKQMDELKKVDWKKYSYNGHKPEIRLQGLISGDEGKFEPNFEHNGALDPATLHLRTVDLDFAMPKKWFRNEFSCRAMNAQQIEVALQKDLAKSKALLNSLIAERDAKNQLLSMIRGREKPAEANPGECREPNVVCDHDTPLKQTARGEAARPEISTDQDDAESAE